MTIATAHAAHAAPLPAWLKIAAPDAAMTVEDVANAIGVTKVQVHRMLAAGQLPPPRHLTQTVYNGHRAQPYRLVWSKAQLIKVWKEHHSTH